MTRSQALKRALRSLKAPSSRDTGPVLEDLSCFLLGDDLVTEPKSRSGRNYPVNRRRRRPEQKLTLARIVFRVLFFGIILKILVTILWALWV